jgi:hypothetical protein
VEDLRLHREVLALEVEDVAAQDLV